MRRKTLITTIALLTLVLSIANIVASNAVATTGEKLQSLNQQADSLKSHNLDLERKVAEKKSLSIIEEKAQELGFVSISQTFNLISEEPLAKLP